MNSSPHCCFCKSSKLSKWYSKGFHPVKKNHGPFDLYKCAGCQSLITWPLPTREQQAELYASFGDGMNQHIRDIRENNPLTYWYQQCINKAIKRMPAIPDTNSEFSWIDIGAGGGELARMMALQYPHSKGMATDFHERPAALHGINNVTWIPCDLNGDFAEKINQRFNLVVSITVIEHVLSPYDFILNSNKLLEQKGTLYITAPCTNTLASKVLGKSWPYIIMGEHLNIPSAKGMDMLLQQLQKEPASVVFSRHTILPYTLGYFLSWFRMPFLKKLLPHSLPVKLPTGILEAGYGFR